MENYLLYVSLFFLVVYIAMVIIPKELSRNYQKISGICYYSFAILLTIYVYQFSHTILYIVLTAIGLFIGMYLIQMILGTIKHYMYRKYYQDKLDTIAKEIKNEN